MKIKKIYIAPQVYMAEYASDIMVVAESTSIDMGGGGNEPEDEDPNAANSRNDFGDPWDYNW